MQRVEVSYAGQNFIFEYNPYDLTGEGSVREIIYENQYHLDLFHNLKGEVFVDIGTAVGVAAVILGKLNPESTVLCFEPYPPSYETIKKNVELNGLTNVVVYNLAVSNASDTILKLNVCPHMSGANSTQTYIDTFKQYYGVDNIVEVNSISFDDIIRNHGITSIKLLKIDCEGAEFDIIYSSELFKTGIVKNMVGEFHDLRYNNALNKSHELIQYCKQYVPELVEMSVLTI